MSDISKIFYMKSWFVNNEKSIKNKNINILLILPLDEQTKKACNLEMSNSNFDANISFWETGEMDITAVSLIDDEFMMIKNNEKFKMEDRSLYEIFNVNTEKDFIDIMNSFMGFIFINFSDLIEG